jgi:hypothetical protein
MFSVFRRTTVRAVLCVAGPLAIALTLTTLASSPLRLETPLHAATSAACDGGAFSIVLSGGQVISGNTITTIPAASLGSGFAVKGKYVEFLVTAASFEVRDYAFTGAPNPLDMTGGVRTPVFARKTPDFAGVALTSDVAVQLSGESIDLQRTGPGIGMKIQANDCAKGGIFQMEPSRGDGGPTIITHVLATAVAPDGANLTAFYFDNPNFRAREGDVVPFKDTTVTVAARINFANDFSPKFVGRDSPQAATRINQPQCTNLIQRRPNSNPALATVQHCGGVSIWSVQSGGRMGGVFGDDAVEVAPPSTTCTHQCQAQDRVRGQALVLGFPFPVPDASRLKPRTP